MSRIVIEKQANQNIINSIYKIALDYTGDYFTINLPEDTKNDLVFQHVMYLECNNDIASFIIFTCWDGSPHITLMATQRESCGKGYGKELMKHFVIYLTELGFNRIELFTVPPDTKPIYKNTVAFYERMGFEIEKVYSQLWETGALKMIKTW
ncbi:MAG: Acetyltransferase domain [Herbinix sp.]|jgi:GNAT superfamily N-acetyltransferase|nr:Acetyltransferase domain [Herbinix sp.]